MIHPTRHCTLIAECGTDSKATAEKKEVEMVRYLLVIVGELGSRGQEAKHRLEM